MWHFPKTTELVGVEIRANLAFGKASLSGLWLVWCEGPPLS